MPFVMLFSCRSLCAPVSEKGRCSQLGKHSQYHKAAQARPVDYALVQLTGKAVAY